MVLDVVKNHIYNQTGNPLASQLAITFNHIMGYNFYKIPMKIVYVQDLKQANTHYNSY